MINLNSSGLLRALSIALLHFEFFCKGSRGQSSLCKEVGSDFCFFLFHTKLHGVSNLFATQKALGVLRGCGWQKLTCFEADAMSAPSQEPPVIQAGSPQPSSIGSFEKFRSSLLQAGIEGPPNGFFGLDKRAGNLCSMVQGLGSVPLLG